MLDVQTSAEETIVGMAGEEQGLESIDPRGLDVQECGYRRVVLH